MSQIDLREYQKQAIEAVRAEWRDGNKRTIVSLPTGTGKCVDENSWVWSYGLHRFGDIYEKTMTIASRHGPAVIRGWHDDGIGMSVKITLDSGQVLMGTPETKLLTRTAEGAEEWVPFKSLTTKHYCAIPLGKAHFGQDEIDPDLAFAFGFFAAGTSGLRTFGEKTRTRASAWALGIWQLIVPLQFADRLMGVIRKWLIEAGSSAVINRVDTAEDASLSIPTPHLREYLPAKYPFLCMETRDLCVPDAIRTAPREAIVAYLQGFMRAYCANAGRGFLRVTSEKLAEQVHQLMLGVGIPVSLRRAQGIGSHKLLMGPFGKQFEILGRQWFSKLHEHMLDEERVSFESIRTRMSFFRFPMGAEGGKLPAKDMPKLGMTGAMWKLRTPSQAALVKTLAELDPADKSPELADLERACRPDVLWGRIESMELRQARHIDVETEEDHEYIANGIVTHNTWMFVFMIHGVRNNGLRSCVIVNTDELVDQTIEKLSLVGVEAGVMKAAKNDYDKPVVVASIQTLSRMDRLQNLPQNHFAFIITDECHYANSPSYQRVLWWFKDAWHLGVTATAFRGDNKSLSKAGWDSIAFYYPIQKAMDDGWLAPAEFIKVQTKTSLSGVKRTKDDVTGEYQFVSKFLEKVINTPERNQLIVDATIKHLSGRRTLCFCSSVAHAVDLANAYRRRSIEAYSVYGQMKESTRKLLLKAHRQGRYPVLTNCRILTTGYDDPALSAIVMATPTESKTLYLQMIGRGLRPHDHKTNCIIMDVVDVTKKFKLATGNELVALEGDMQRAAARAQKELS